MNGNMMLIIVACLAAVGLFAEPGAAVSERGPETVVLSLPVNDFHGLAEEIASTEGIPLVRSWNDALSFRPRFILWVSHADGLSDRAMVEAGLGLKAQKSFPAVGLITGRTEKAAADLYRRSGAVRGERVFAVNGEFPAAGIPGTRILSFEGGSGSWSVLPDAGSLLPLLADADYLTFTGHGSGNALWLREGEGITAGMLPPLKSVVVSSAGCQTFRPWQKDSVALGFIEHGAAAYAGFVHSPMEGYLLGEFTELPFRYSSPEFPIGTIAAMQSWATMRGFAWFPYYFMIGDPRISLHGEPPYRPVGEKSISGGIELSYEGGGNGLIPVFIEGGGKFRYIEIPGVGTFFDGDRFFNSRLLSYGLNGDRYVLFRHPGGPFTLRLKTGQPLFRAITHPVAVGFDQLALSAAQGGGDVIFLAAGICFSFVFILILGKRRKIPGFPAMRLLVSAVSVGAAAAVLLGGWQRLRLTAAAVNMKPMSFKPLWILGMFLLWGSGSGLFLSARKAFGKIVGLLVMLMPALFPVLFVAGVMEFINILARSRYGSNIYGYAMSTVYLVPAAVFAVVMAAVLPLLKRGLHESVAGTHSGEDTSGR